MADLASAFLLHGDDGAKLDAALARLRERAEEEGGATGLEVFRPADGARAPDADALIGSIPAMSLTAGRRYLLAECVQGWSPADGRRVAEALADIPPETTVVLVARTTGRPSKPAADVIKVLAGAVKEVKGEVREYSAPGARKLPSWLVQEASVRGFRLAPDAAKLIIERLSGPDRRDLPSQVRLANELDRLALWAGAEGVVSAADIEEMVAGSAAAASYALADAIVEGDPERAVAIADRLLAQGEEITALVYRLAPRLRDSLRAAAMLAEGTSPKSVQSSLPMSPYAARVIVEKAARAEPERLRSATTALADLEAWTRGDAEYGDELALTLAVRRAATG